MNPKEKATEIFVYNLNGDDKQNKYYEKVFSKCINIALKKQAKEIINKIKIYFPHEQEEITCRCDSCKDTFYNLVERDKLIESIKKGYGVKK